MDSGVQISLVSEKCINKIKLKQVSILPSNNITIRAATNALYKIKSQAYINIKIHDVEFNASVPIVPDLIYDVILGIVTLVKVNAILYFAENTLTCVTNNTAYD